MPGALSLALNTLVPQRLEVAQRTPFAEYRDRPIEFVSDVLGVEPWSRQRDILEALNRPRARVAVKACHASGKTWTAAAAACWFLNCEPNSVVLTTAPTTRQVRELLWREIRGQNRAAKQRLIGRILDRDTRWEVADKWYALGFSTDEPERFQGFHAGRILVIEDEASGILEPIHASIEGVLSSGDARLLLIGNPTQVAGHFHGSFTNNRTTVRALTISAFDTPNLTGEGDFPMLVSPEWVEERRREWGEDSDLWRVRVLGEFPRGTLDTVIALADIEAARVRELKPSEPVEIGVDVARHGDDRTVIVGRAGPVIVGLEVLAKRDTVFVAGRTGELAHDWGARFGAEPARIPIKVDDSGVGGGVTDILGANGLNAVPVIAGAKAIEPERYPNRRSELWFTTAGRLKDEDADLTRLSQDHYDALVAELTTPKWKMDSRGRRMVEPKDEFKKRIGRSPDLADALNLAFAPAPNRDVAYAPGLWN